MTDRSHSHTNSGTGFEPLAIASRIALGCPAQSTPMATTSTILERQNGAVLARKRPAHAKNRAVRVPPQVRGHSTRGDRPDQAADPRFLRLRNLRRRLALEQDSGRD